MFKRMFVPLGLVALLAVAWVDQQRSAAYTQNDEKSLFTRLIGPHTIFFLHSRPGDMANLPVMQALFEKMPDMKSQFNKRCKEFFGVEQQDIETLTVYLDQPSMESGAPSEPRPPYMLMHASKPVDAANVLAGLGKEITTIKFGKHELNANKDRGVAFLDSQTVLMFTFESRHSVEKAKQELIIYFAGLDAALEVPQGLQKSVTLASAGKHAVVAGIAPSKELSAFLQEQAGKMPPMMAPFKPLIKTQSAVLTVDYGATGDADTKVSIRGQFEDEGGAKAGMGSVRFAIAAAKMGLSSIPGRNEAEMKDIFDFASKQLDVIKVDVDKSEVVVNYQVQMTNVLPALLSAIERVRNAADRMMSASNMRQLIIAMHNYHNDYNKMPEVMTLKNGKPMHSWRVMLLPYLEQDNVFKQVKMDEPWDSEANKKLFESIPMPKLFEHPGKKDGDSRMTYYKVFYSKADAKIRAGFSLGKPMTLGQMTVQDGTSNTISLIEAGPPVLWYKPDDIEFDAKAQLPNMISPWKDKRVNVGFFDAAIRSAWLGTDEDTWKGFITVNGGEAVDFSKIEEKK